MNILCLLGTAVYKNHSCRQLCLLSALSIALSGCSDNGNTVSASDQSVPEQTAPEQPAEGIAAPDFSAPIVLSEGATALQLSIPIARAEDNTDTLKLLISQEYRDQYPALSIELESDTLPAGEDQFELKLGYGLSVAPIKPLAIQIPLQISGSDDVLQRLLTLQINPTMAPDVYLLIGQSNMTGASEHGSKQSQAGELDAPDPRIQQLNVTSNDPTVFSNSLDSFSDPALNVNSPAIVIAQVPVHDELPANQTDKPGDQIGPALSFAKAALPDTNSTILLVPAAWGGSGFCGNSDFMTSWNTGAFSDPALGGTGLYHRAILRTDIALEQSAGVLRGILWHQGESDAINDHCADQYAQNLRQLVNALRQNISVDARGPAARGETSDIPFIVGTLSAGADERGDFSINSTAQQTVDNVIRSIAELVGHAAFSNNDDLVPPAYPCGDTACHHFGATAIREMGQRYYLALTAVNEQ